MQPAQPSMLEMIFPFAVVMVVMYFFMIRPQSKRAKEHDSFLKNLKRGDQIVTASGIVGTIDGMTDQFVTLEVSTGVKIKVLRKQVATLLSAVMSPSVTPVNGEAKKV